MKRVVKYIAYACRPIGHQLWRKGLLEFEVLFIRRLLEGCVDVLSQRA